MGIIEFYALLLQNQLFRAQFVFCKTNLCVSQFFRGLRSVESKGRDDADCFAHLSLSPPPSGGAGQGFNFESRPKKPRTSSLLRLRFQREQGVRERGYHGT